MGEIKPSFRPDQWIAAILLLTMATIAFINVLSRYLFHFSFAATEELTINLFVWMTVVGSGIAFRRSAHLGMITLFNIFPTQFKKMVILFSSTLSALLFIILNIYMIQAIYDELTIFHATSGALDVPVWIYYIGVPLLSIFVFKGIYRDAVTKLAALQGKTDR